MKPFTTFSLCLLLLIFTDMDLYAQSISGIVNSYYQVTAVDASSNTVTVSNAAGLTPKTRVLLIQMKGATINGANSASFGDITSINNAGNYEMNTICSVNGNIVALKYQLLNSYTASEPVQLVTVPSYPSVTISDSIFSSPWDTTSNTGGIVAIEASDTIYLNSGIDVSGQGFTGGALQNYPVPPFDCEWYVDVTDYYMSLPTSGDYTGGTKGEGVADYIANEQYGRGNQANGGGGGNNNNTGGAGGANYGAGGNGGQRISQSVFDCQGDNPGLGGLALSSYGYSTAQNRIFLGGGGGGGHENNGVGEPGGNGGGIVLLTANVIVSSGNVILANGSVPVNSTNTDPYAAEGDGGGGGGAGGTVLINAGTISGSLNIMANGTNGTNSSYEINDCTGPGGGGGGGLVWTAGSSFPAAITASVTGGSNGVVSLTSTSTLGCQGSANSATPGSNGATQSGYVLPASTTQVCTPLPIPGLLYFTGTLISGGAILTWFMNSTVGVASYELQSSSDQLTYQTVATIMNSGEQKLYYTDARIIEGTTYYRLMMKKTDGSFYYSEIVPLTRNSEGSLQFVSLQPNPAAANLMVTMYAKMIGTANLVIFDSYGQTVASFSEWMVPGYNKITLPLTSLAAGAYFIRINGNNFSSVKGFIKQ